MCLVEEMKQRSLTANMTDQQSLAVANTNMLGCTATLTLLVSTVMYNNIMKSIAIISINFIVYYYEKMSFNLI